MNLKEEHFYIKKEGIAKYSVYSMSGVSTLTDQKIAEFSKLNLAVKYLLDKNGKSLNIAIQHADSTDRLQGTDSLVKIYKSNTPGQ